MKPSIGFDADQSAALAGTLAGAGIDFIKDDELQVDGAVCPFDTRVDRVMRLLNAHADRTGKRVMYAFNLTGEIDAMRRRHDLMRDAGGNPVTVSLNAVGLLAIDQPTPLIFREDRLDRIDDPDAIRASVTAICNPPR